MTASRDPKGDALAGASFERIVRCPACGGASVYGPGNAYRPFCGERCKTADLGAWATESYRVAAEPPEDGDEGLTPPAMPGSGSPPLH